MRGDKLRWLLIPAVCFFVIFGAGGVRDLMADREKTRVEALLKPVLDQSFASFPDPKPTLAFLILTDKSVQLVVRLEAKGLTIEDRNALREQILAGIQKELIADPQSWGKFTSVTFIDELVTQSSK